MAKRCRLVAALRRHQQEFHQAAEVLCRAARAEVVTGFPDRRDFLFGQHAAALLFGCLADVRHEICRDQILLRRPSHHRSETLQQAVARDHGVGLDHGVTGRAQVGFRELVGRQRQIRAERPPHQAHRLGQRPDAFAFLGSQRLVTVEQCAERERIGRARVRCGCRRHRAAVDPFRRLAGGLARLGQAHGRMIAERHPQLLAAGAIAIGPGLTLGADPPGSSPRERSYRASRRVIVLGSKGPRASLSPCHRVRFLGPIWVQEPYTT